MFRATKFLIIKVCLLWAVSSQTSAQSVYSETRGELLYSTHCVTCHDTEIHWREKKLVQDWRTLWTEVNRWQSNLGLGWSDDEIMDVTDYLNTIYYHFSAADRKDFAEND